MYILAFSSENDGRDFKLNETLDWANVVKGTTSVSWDLQYSCKCKCMTIKYKMSALRCLEMWPCFGQIQQSLSHPAHVIYSSTIQWYSNCIIVHIYTKNFTVNFLLFSFFNFWSLTYVKESVLTYKVTYKTCSSLHLYYIWLQWYRNTFSLCWPASFET